MAGLKRRRKPEGWALSDSELKDESRYVSKWQRLADNNKLWFCCLIAVLLLASFLYRNAQQGGAVKSDVEVSKKVNGAYNDKAHTEFAQQFRYSSRYKTLLTDARFVGPGAFRLAVRGSSSSDDIDYVSKLAAQKILSRFKTKVVVRTYMKRSGYSGEMLVATAQWEPKKYGFVVKFNREAK